MSMQHYTAHHIHWNSYKNNRHNYLYSFQNK